MVCSNTVRHAMQSGQGNLKFRSTTNGIERLENAVQLLGLVGQNADTFKQKLELLQSKRLTSDIKESFYKVMGFTSAFDKQNQLRTDSKLVETIDSQSANYSAGTLYGFLNQFTAAYSHSDGMAEGQRLRGNVSDETRKLAMFGNSEFGGYAQTKEKALSTLLALVK
jgi:hypothetical protein